MMQQRLQTAIVDGAIEEPKRRQLKQDWNVGLSRHTALFHDWEDTSQQINAGMGDRVCYVHFEPLKTIE